MSLVIDGRKIGPDQPTLVIAEIGVNHDGSVDRALELVDHAAAAGADAVKLQIFHASTLIHGTGELAGYQKERTADADAAGMLRRYELSDEEDRRVVAAIRARGMVPLATPFSLADVETIAELELPAIKIASPDCVNLPLLKRAASLHRPLLVSTGAATIGEVADCVGWLTDWGASFALLHCVSSYPTAPEDAHLGWIAGLSHRFGVPVGFSDHTAEPITGALAVVMGARIIEKHLTYDRGAAGPDHAASADPRQLAEYIRSIRLAERMRGLPKKTVLPAEEDVRRVSRQSLVLARDVAAGQRLCEADLMTQRPGTGIAAARYYDVLGRTAVRALGAGTMLGWEMLGAGKRMNDE